MTLGEHHLQQPRRPPVTHEHQGSSDAVDGNSYFCAWECENKGDGTDPWPGVLYIGIVKATVAIIRARRAKGDNCGLKGKSTIGHKEWSDWKPYPRGIDMKDDGPENHWATSRHEGDEPGTWAWPERA